VQDTPIDVQVLGTVYYPDNIQIKLLTTC